MKYKVHKLNLKLAQEPELLESFLNNLEGEVVAVIPNVTTKFLYYGSKVNTVLIVEKIKKTAV